MIIQRLASAIRHQNWSQIITEILIVIIGIFLGLQVQAWYEERNAAKEEEVYLQRLHDEVAQVAIRVEQNVQIRSAILNALETGVNMLTGRQSDGILGPPQCRGIVQSHIYVNLVGSLSTISEIQSNNRSTDFQNAEITAQITEYVLFIERWNALITSIGEGKAEISRVYPDLVTLTDQADIRSVFNEDGHYICDFEGIKANNGAINDIYSNSRRYRAFVDFLREQSRILNRLHQLLDQELVITHAGEN